MELRNLFKRDKKEASSTPDSAKGPQGKPSLEVKPDTNRMATRIKKTPLYIAAAIAGIGIYGGYEYIQSHPLFGNTKAPQTVNIEPASDTGHFASPPQKKYHKPKAPGSATGAATAATGSVSSAQSAAQPPQASGVPKENPYAAQDAAFQASLGTGSSGGSGGMAVSWKSNTNSAPSTPSMPATLPAAVPGQDHGKQTKKSTPPLVTRETSPYELLSGSVIPAVLQTGIKSYLPGKIMAVVSRNVYSSVNGATLLIPAGSKLVGTYDTKTTLGTNRLAVAWTRIEYPNGTTMNLPGFESAGGSGYAGFAGDVNNHTWLTFKNALLLSLVDIGMAVGSPTSTSSNTTGVTGNEALQYGEQGLTQTFGQAEAQMLQKYIDIAPTITIHPGYLFSVVVARDMVFPGPYNPIMQTGSAAIEPALGPKPNPYG